MNSLTQQYHFDGQPVRCFTIDGNPWFVAVDACRILGINNVSLAVNGNPSRPETGGLDEDEKGVCSVNTLGGTQELLCVSESGLYNLIFRSRKPEAKRFKKWVTSEVLPAIRKNGRYVLEEAPQPVAPQFPIPATYAEALRLAADQAETIQAQKLELADAAPKLEVYNRVLDGEGLFGFRQVAGMLADKSLGPVNLVRRLLDDKIIYRNARGELMAFRDHINAGRFKCIETPYDHPDSGETRVSCNLKVTTKGVAFIARHFKTTVVADAAA